MISESAVLRIGRSVLAEYEASRFYRALLRLGRSFAAKCRESAILSFLFRDGSPDRSWSGSLTCRVLTFLLSLPGVLLHLLYRRFQKTFDESRIAGLLFEVGDSAAILESWLLLGLWVIPFRRWNNAYHLMGFLLLLGFLWLWQMRSGKKLRLDRIGFYPVLLFGAACLAVLSSLYPWLSGRFLRYHIICALCVLTTVNSVRSAADMKRLLFGVSCMVLVSAVYGLIQRAQGIAVEARYVDLSLNSGMPGRVQSYFDNPNTYAQVLVLLLPPVLGLTVCAKRRISRVGAAFVLLMGLLAIGMTYSRSGWIGLAAAVLFFVLLRKPKLVPALILAAILCVPLLPKSIVNRILTIGLVGRDTSVTSRFPLYRAGFRLICARPLLGAGLGIDAVREYIIDYNVYYTMIYYSHLHDLFLQVWAETGLPGIVGLVGSSFWGMKHMVRAQRRPGSRTVKVLTAACCSALAGGLLVGVVDYIWHYPRVMCMFWFVFALGLSGVRLLIEGEDAHE